MYWVWSDFFFFFFGGGGHFEEGQREMGWGRGMLQKDVHFRRMWGWGWDEGVLLQNVHLRRESLGLKRPDCCWRNWHHPSIYVWSVGGSDVSNLNLDLVLLQINGKLGKGAWERKGRGAFARHFIVICITSNMRLRNSAVGPMRNDPNNSPFAHKIMKTESPEFTYLSLI